MVADLQPPLMLTDSHATSLPWHRASSTVLFMSPHMMPLLLSKPAYYHVGSPSHEHRAFKSTRPAVLAAATLLPLLLLLVPLVHMKGDSRTSALMAPNVVAQRPAVVHQARLVRAPTVPAPNVPWSSRASVGRKPFTAAAMSTSDFFAQEPAKKRGPTLATLGLSLIVAGLCGIIGVLALVVGLKLAEAMIWGVKQTSQTPKAPGLIACARQRQPCTSLFTVRSRGGGGSPVKDPRGCGSLSGCSLGGVA